ncbi:MAG: acyl-CoA reductase [Lachnospiraceae bacterium]|nr:acyl-CoA reductase [Lachnospiraceae bacterium]
MILFEGKLLQDEALDEVLDKLWESCLQAITHREDIAEKVMEACGRVAQKIRNGAYDEILQPLLNKGTFSRKQLEEVIGFFDRENLQLKYDTELGDWKKAVEGERMSPRIKRVQPLGILFHIAAGNAEGLPFYSVLEGMLAGNVNILKLPSMDDGISVLLLHEIIKEEPSLAPYACVLDVPSTNMKVMKRLADMADGIVVWGGDEAIHTIRTYAAPETQIISWGHKLSFAYVSPAVLTKQDLQQELYALARHICMTRQVLCSSCQGLFVDSSDMAVVNTVGERFFNILKEVSDSYPPESIGVRGKIFLSLYNEELENEIGTKNIYKEKNVSVIVSKDSALQLSYMFRNCWVKPLPAEHIVSALKAHRGHLQTVGLVCEKEEYAALADKLMKAGVTRITRAGHMSQTIPGEAHDGEYPLQRYVKIVETEVW